MITSWKNCLFHLGFRWQEMVFLIKTVSKGILYTKNCVKPCVLKTVLSREILSTYVVFCWYVQQSLWLLHLLIFVSIISTYIRVIQKFGIKVYWRLQFSEYLGTLSLKFQKARTKTEVVLSLPSWLSQLKVPKYSRNCSLQYTLIPWSLRKCDAP
jgi:hypothetical protein